MPRGPRLSAKIRMPKFKPNFKLPKLVRQKSMMKSGLKSSIGMLKGIKKKSLFPKLRMK